MAITNLHLFTEVTQRTDDRSNESARAGVKPRGPGNARNEAQRLAVTSQSLQLIERTVDELYRCACAYYYGEGQEITMRSFKIEISNFLKARFPFLYISTWEEERLLSSIASIAADEALIKTPRTLFIWSQTTGMTGGGEPAKEETRSPLKALEFIEKFADPSLFVLKDFHIYFGGQGRAPDFQIIRKLRDLVPKLKASPKAKNVIFVSPSLVLPNELQKEITIIDFDLPSASEICELLDEMIAANRRGGRIKIDLQGDDHDLLVKAALGLTLQEAENAFALAMVKDGCLNVQDVEVIISEKRQIIKKTEILEFIESELDMNDVGGLENLKRWLLKRNKSWHESAQRYCLPAPRGVLITGVPG